MNRMSRMNYENLRNMTRNSGIYGSEPWLLRNQNKVFPISYDHLTPFVLGDWRPNIQSSPSNGNPKDSPPTFGPSNRIESRRTRQGINRPGRMVGRHHQTDRNNWSFMRQPSLLRELRAIGAMATMDLESLDLNSYIEASMSYFGPRIINFSNGMTTLSPLSLLFSQVTINT